MSFTRAVYTLQRRNMVYTPNGGVGLQVSKELINHERLLVSSVKAVIHKSVVT